MRVGQPRGRGTSTVVSFVVPRPGRSSAEASVLFRRLRAPSLPQEVGTSRNVCSYRSPQGADTAGSAQDSSESQCQSRCLSCDLHHSDRTHSTRSLGPGMGRVVCSRVLPGKAMEGTKREGHRDLAGMIILGGYVRTAQGPQLGPVPDCAVGSPSLTEMKVALLELACAYRNSYYFKSDRQGDHVSMAKQTAWYFPLSNSQCCSAPPKAPSQIKERTAVRLLERLGNSMSEPTPGTHQRNGCPITGQATPCRGNRGAMSPHPPDPRCTKWLEQGYAH